MVFKILKGYYPEDLIDCEYENDGSRKISRYFGVVLDGEDPKTSKNHYIVDHLQDESDCAELEYNVKVLHKKVRDCNLPSKVLKFVREIGLTKGANPVPVILATEVTNKDLIVRVIEASLRNDHEALR